MVLRDIVFAPKLSKVGLDQNRFLLTEEALRAQYRTEGIDPEVMFESHEAQQRCVRRFRSVFRQSRFVERSEITPDIVEAAPLVVSLGGDNHLHFVARYATRTPILGINSDPGGSTGALLNGQATDPEFLAEALRNDRLTVVEWLRIRVWVGGVCVGDAMNDVYLGEYGRPMMSRHILATPAGAEVQKCSGLLVATGAGSTGWYKSAGRYLHNVVPFPRDSREVRFLVTEPGHPDESPYRYLHGALTGEERVSVVSNHDDHGVVCLDSVDTVPFSRGKSAAVGISPRPIRVVGHVG